MSTTQASAAAEETQLQAGRAVSGVRRFNAWTNLVLTPLVEIALVGGAVAGALAARRAAGLGWAATIALAWGLLVAATLLALRLLRALWPIRRGALTATKTPWAFYVWTLWTFLATTNLHALYVTSVLPVNFRKTLYRLLGAKLGRGFMVLGGAVFDPYLVTLEENVMLGYDSILSPHYFTRDAEDTVVLGRIHLERGVVVGVRACLGPGVHVGEFSVVSAMAGVRPFTRIPPYEIWEGAPARKVGDVPRPAPTA